MRTHEDFKKENYVIPLHTIGGSTRPDAISSTSGSAVTLVPGVSVGQVTIFGTQIGSTAVVWETLTVSSTANVSSTGVYTNVYGMRIGNVYGTNAFSTASGDLSLVSAANTSHEVARISSGYKSTKGQLYQLTGQNVTVHNTTGLVYMKPNAIFPTSNNAYKIPELMVRDLRISGYQPFLFLESDTGGATVQIIVHED